MRAALELGARLYYLLGRGHQSDERIRRYLNEKIDSTWELAQIWLSIGRDLSPVREAYFSWQTIGRELGHEVSGSPPDEESKPWLPRHRGKIGNDRSSAHELLKQLFPDDAPRWLDRTYKELSAVHGTAHLADLMSRVTLPDKAAFHSQRLLAFQYTVFAAINTLAVHFGWPYASTHQRVMFLVKRTMELANQAMHEAENLDPGPSQPPSAAEG